MDENKCAVHEKHECLLNPQLMGKDESRLTFVKFLASASLTVAAMALIIISPMFLYPMLLGYEEPYNYIALAIFWAVILGVSVFAGVTDYLRKGRRTW